MRKKIILYIVIITGLYVLLFYNSMEKEKFNNKMESIYVENNYMSKSITSQLNTKALEEVYKYKNLETLEIRCESKNEKLDIGPEILKNKNVTGLRIKNCDSYNEVNLSNFKNVEELSLIDNSIKKIENFENLDSLKKLQITFNDIKTIENLETMESLKEIYLDLDDLVSITQESYDYVNEKGIKIFCRIDGKKKSIEYTLDELDLIII